MPSPLLSVDLASPSPVYRQIADALRALLVDRSLLPGDILPPIRQLGLDLGVHFNTVAQAYRILAAEGWLDLRRRRGALVLDRSEPAGRDPQTALTHLRRRLRELTAELRAAGIHPHRIAAELRDLAIGMDQSQ